MQVPKCQLTQLPHFHEPLGTFGRTWQFRNRLKRFVKRRVMYFRNRFCETVGMCTQRSTSTATTISGQLQPGELVRVKSKEEIKATLNRWNNLHGTAFMEEMWPYCGTTQRVMKRVERFLDERDYRVKKVREMVILEGVICQGTLDFGPCDRSCFFFWKEEWLEKIRAQELVK